jgi:hypothetical protein
MAFADPQTITINAVPYTLPRTSSGSSSGVFTKDDGTVRMFIGHSQGKRIQDTMRVEFQKIAPNPLISAQNISYSMSASVRVDRPLTGFTVVEAKQVCDGLFALLTATSGAKTTQLLGGES